MRVMTKKRPDPTGQPNGKKIFRKLIKLRVPMHEALLKLAERMGTDESEEIRAAVRERLEKFQLWPPKTEE